MASKEKKGFKLPHQLVILFCIAAIAMAATYIVPAGVYEQIEINGRKAIDASSFHYVDQAPVSPWTALLALTGGFVKNAGIIAMITFIAGAIQVINATKCIDASVNFGDGITNLVTPVSTVLMAGLGFAGIPLDRWYKFMWKWLVAAVLLGAVFVTIGVAINYGPF